MRFVIQEDKILTTETRRAVQEFAVLARRSSERKLKPAEAKRFARLQTQLMRACVIVPLTADSMRKEARLMYRSLPWWRKAVLRARYHIKYALARCEAFWLQLRS